MVKSPISVAIGQGPLVVTPLQVANMMAAISNGGTVYRPHVVKMIEKVNPDGKVEQLQVAAQVLHKVTLAPKALETVKLGLWKVVNEEGGTGGNARIEGLDVDAAPLAKLLYESRVREQFDTANLDLSNPDTLEAIKEGQAPIPGQVKKAPAAPAGSNPALGH
jgi:membrane carboxypeptidase/penicillin-binding protein